MTNRLSIVHIINPLNMHCRLARIIGRRWACKIGRCYEKYLFKPILVPTFNIKYEWRCKKNAK